MLQSLFYPKSIAVIGASSNPKKIGNSIAKNILSNKYKGKVYFVNINKDIILGKKSFASITDIPGKIDVSIIVIPAKAVNSVLEACGKIGVTNAIVISAGFSEIGKEGKKLEDEMKRIAEKYNMRILGPNCLGILNSQNGLNASFADGMIHKGNVAFFSQSGALCSAMLDWANQRYLGFSQFISVGNKAVIDEAHILEYLVKEKSSEVILGYLEGFKNGKKFIEIAKKNPLKPVILLKGAESQEGVKAAASHTGAIAQDDNVVDAAMKSAHIIRAKNLEEFFHLSMFFSWQPMIAGNKIAILTNAGGMAVVTTDAIAKSRLSLAEFGGATQNTLKKFLPLSANIKNPLDIIGDADPKRYKNAILAIKDDKNIHGMIFLLTPQTVTDVEKTAKCIVSAMKRCQKPAAACFLGGKKVLLGAEILMKNRIPVFDYPDQAVYIFDVMHQYAKKRGKLRENSEGEKYKKICLNIALYENLKKNIQKVKKSGVKSLNFMECLNLLREYEIPSAKSVLVSSPEEITKKLKDMSFPMVAKIDSPEVIHKTDVGGVKSNISDIVSAKIVYHEIIGNIKKKAPEARVQGIIFQEMVNDSLELIIGSKRDPQFGPVILFGLGGIYVEIMKDVSLGLAPITVSMAREMVEEVKFYSLLKGARGQAGYDIEAIVDCINKVSQLMVDFEEIQEIDINPLMVARGGGGIKAVDCRIII